MNELLLQTIVEKLEVLEVTLLKESEARKENPAQRQLLQQVKIFQSEFEGFKSQLTENNGKLNKLVQNILAPDNPKQNTVKHIHYFHNRLWVTVSIYLISLFLSYGWINCHNEKKAFETNDLKYRYWKASGNKSLLKSSYYTDSLYNLDKDNFEKEVLNFEKKIAEEEKMLRLDGQKNIKNRKN
ncbi:MAG: hypothetical protein M3Z26_06260 [Bacteroidota bacterium]|nr:hypothetical protein [Bacteroidota bacterium]